VLFTFAAAKDVGSQSPAESVTAYYNPNRKQKYHFKSKPSRPVAVTDHVADSMQRSQGSASGSWSVSGTSQWQYPTDVIVNTSSDLLHLQQFLVGKVGFIYVLHVLAAMCVFI